MKRFLAILMCLLLVFAIVGCQSNTKTEAPKAEEPSKADTTKVEPKEEPKEEVKEEAKEEPKEEPQSLNIKVGFICLHDENSTYDLNFINAAKAACETLGITDYVIKTNIPEGKECFETAADMADSGCKIVFADSFGHEAQCVPHRWSRSHHTPPYVPPCWHSGQRHCCFPHHC